MLEAVRSCCGQPHEGAVCPDGLVMCALCFRRVALSELLPVRSYGDGPQVVYQDVCLGCYHLETGFSSEE